MGPEDIATALDEALRLHGHREHGCGGDGMNNMVDCELYCVTLDRAPTNDVAYVGVAMVLLFLQPAFGGCIGTATRGGMR